MMWHSTLLSRQFASWDRHAGKWSGQQIEVACLVLACLIAFCDYVAGRNVALDFIYAVPICISAWFVGRAGAFFVALASVAFWLLINVLEGYYSGVAFTLVNVAVRAGLYGLLVIALARLSHLQHNLERRAEYRAKALAREKAERERLEQDMIDISEREQRRVGRDLHDGLCQHLLGAAYTGQALVETLSSGGRDEAGRVRRLVDLIEEAIVLARGIAKGLYPVGMEQDGLMQALEEFAATISRVFGVECDFVCPGPVLLRNQATATHLFRIAQEAVSNAIKHGQARNIVILLDETEEGIILAVSDDGSGLAKESYTSGMGLRIMADRASLIGGHFSITGKERHGTLLSCVIPATRGNLAQYNA